MDKTAVAKMIDHTILKPDAREQDILQLCREAKAYGFAAVCVNPCWVKLCAERLLGSGVAIATVIGFPLGASSTDVKAFEAKKALEDGAAELDMVLNIGLVKDGKWNLVEQDIAAVVKQTQGSTVQVKVILETALLSPDEIIEACQRAVRAGAHFIKTSTGFGSSGAAVEDVRLMRKTVGPAVGVKASGGIRTAEVARDMLTAGANRIGTSSGVVIIETWQE